MSQLSERAVAVWPLLIAEVLIFGTAAFAMLLAPSPDSRPDGVAHSMGALWRGLSVVAFLASPLALLVDTAGMADVSPRDAIPFLPQVLHETQLGRVWSWSFPMIVALLIVAWVPGRRSWRTATVGVLAGALLLLRSLSGHAIDRGATAVIVYFIHEAAAGLWFGAILGLWLGVVRGKFGESWVQQTVPRVSRLATWSVAALMATGAYTAFGALGWSPDRLLYSLYGRTLLWKLVTASTVLLLGGYNRYRLVPAVEMSSARVMLVRSVAAECVLLAGVLAWSALLANTPPPH